jgi:monooxygenase
LSSYDVVIVGAGLSGIGAACHLQRESPGKSYTILEARESIGGTWDLFRYPGVRSDSDMFTLGYRFRPWREAKAIADGESILRYVKETARDHGVESKIRFGARVVKASWSNHRWNVELSNGESIDCAFLWVCSGYYRYDHGYEPRFEGQGKFAGKLIHPQFWPRDLDYSNKKIVVIGSGATAVTLVPSLAEKAAQVTMLQRSPSYIMSLPARDPIANVLRTILPAKLAYPLVRWKNVLLATLMYQLSRRRPALMRKLLRRGAVRALPHGYQVDTHFNPKYQPWDQRLCLIPDGDLFQSIKSGRASIVTGELSRFDEKGIGLANGEHIDADIVVTATGLELLAFGGMKLSVDGRELELSKSIGYKGMMLCGVPNFAYVLGYTNASWTLKADLVSSYVCRLHNRMSARGEKVCIPRAPDPSLPVEPILDLNSGYVRRAVDQLPKQGVRWPYRLYQNYIRDVFLFRWGKLADEAMEFRR